MENTKYGKRREGQWTPIRAKAQDTRANPNSWGTHLVRKRWDIGLLRALSLRITMMILRYQVTSRLPRRLIFSPTIYGQCNHYRTEIAISCRTLGLYRTQVL